MFNFKSVTKSEAGIYQTLEPNFQKKQLPDVFVVSVSQLISIEMLAFQKQSVETRKLPRLLQDRPYNSTFEIASYSHLNGP